MQSKEEELLQDIKKRLDALWPLIDFYNTHTELSDYSAPIIEASKIVEKMIVLLLFERGFEWDLKHGVIIDLKTKEPKSNDPVRRRRFGSALSAFLYAQNNYLKEMPIEIKEYLEKIRLYRNQAVHVETSNGEAVLASVAFDRFVGWFIGNSNILKDLGLNSVKSFLSCYEKFNNGMTLQLKADNSKTEEYIISSIIPQVIESVKKGLPSSDWSSSQDLKKILRILEELQSGMIRVEKKVDVMGEKLNEISDQIGNYQSLVTKQIKMARTEDEIDRIMGAFTDECVSRIVRNIKQSLAEQEYFSEKDKLVMSLGETVWNKLDSSSQNFLITAKVTYNNLFNKSDVMDFSGVCLLVTKAVEVEMDKRFYKDFLSYLNNKKAKEETGIQLPTGLLKWGKPLEPQDFTLGSVAYVLCYRKPNNTKPEQAERDLCITKEYFSACLMKGQDEKAIETHIRMIAEGVETIRTNFRNPSAHKDQLQYINAQQCFDLVLDVEKFLKKAIEVLDY